MRRGQQGQSILTVAEKVWRVGLGHLVFSSVHNAPTFFEVYKRDFSQQGA